MKPKEKFIRRKLTREKFDEKEIEHIHLKNEWKLKDYRSNPSDIRGSHEGVEGS